MGISVRKASTVVGLAAVRGLPNLSSLYPKDTAAALYSALPSQGVAAACAKATAVALIGPPTCTSLARLLLGPLSEVEVEDREELLQQPFATGEILRPGWVVLDYDATGRRCSSRHLTASDSARQAPSAAAMVWCLAITYLTTRERLTGAKYVTTSSRTSSNQPVVVWMKKDGTIALSSAPPPEAQAATVYKLKSYS